MRRLTALFTLSLLALAGSAGAATQAKKLTLNPDLEGSEPLCRVLSQDAGRMSLEFTLPSLELQEMELEGERYQALGITSGGLRGEEGQPGLPSYSRLVAVPEGLNVTARVTAREQAQFADFRVLPVQPADAESFVIDREVYNQGQFVAPAPVEVGEVAYIRHLRVVPLTFSPVSYDPVSGELRVAHHMEVELEFTDSGERQAEAPGMIPESFDRLFSDQVLGYERSADQQVGPGTYLIISPDNAGVTSRLQPLLDWRREQGYNVRHATTAETGTTENNIKIFIQNVYDTYDPPLEHVVLAGDAGGTYNIDCWYENLSNYHGEGDHYYTNLEGGDILADIHIGRLSYQNYTTLENIVDKILTYESNPPTTDAGWFTRAGLAGDPYTSSGITTVYVNQWLKSQLLEQGYTQVDTLWNPNSGTMSSTINQGLSAFGYRGWLGMSGMTTTAILNLSNARELPYAIVVTCDTGSFQDDNACRSEAFLRAANGGGIGSVGTATTGTHTRYNNCYYNGAWDGAINGSDHRLGFSHTLGKLGLYTNYNLSEPNRVNIWSMWNNLMGDPATPMWTAYPADMSAIHPAELAVGANALPISVSSGGNPVEGARVALFKEDELRVTGYTDENGDLTLPLADYSGGDLRVTIIKHNHMPYQADVSIGAQPIFLASDSHVVDDDKEGGSNGNGDGLVNPGETIELSVLLRNYGSNMASAVSAVLSSSDPYVSILDNAETFGDIPSGGTAWSEEDFDIVVAEDAPDGHLLELKLVASSGLGNWTSLLQIPVHSSSFSYESMSWGGSGDGLDPGESGTFSVEVSNSGGMDIGGAVAVLRCASPFVTVTDPFGGYGTMNQGAMAENIVNPFALSIDPDCFEGHQARFILTFILGGGAQASTEFTLEVGSVSSNDPTGPDAYGYYAFDNTDTGYDYAPVYDWVEIASNHGGPGTDLGLSDFGWEQDDTEYFDLPFTFSFYGMDYDQISICSNGWVSMGTCYLEHYRNWSLPSAGSPDRLIAPYWDNLYQTSQDRVYTWHDSANHRLIIQWSRLRNDWNNATENFQLILHDPVYYPTATGDGEMLFLYNIINNTDSRDGYGTVGIQNQDHTDGLLYTYWNQYTPGSPSLAAGRAIRILTIHNEIEASLAVSPESLDRLMLPNTVFHDFVEISNDGEVGSVLSWNIDDVAPPPPLGSAPLVGDRDFGGWLILNASGGDLAAGESAVVQVTYDTDDMADGVYERLLVVTSDDGAPKQIPVTLTVDASGTAADEVLAVLSLGQNHPNPFNPKTRISFALPAASDVRLAIYGVKGQRLRTLVNGQLPAGRHQAQWDGRDDEGRDLSAGVYFYRLESSEQILSRKMLLLK